MCRSIRGAVCSILLACSLVISGCLGAGAPSDGPPAWVLSGGGVTDEGEGAVLLGVGAARGVGARELMVMVADNRARADITERLLSLLQGSTKGLKGSVLSALAEEGGAQALVVDHWQTAGGDVVYAVARLDEEVFRRAIERVSLPDQETRESLAAQARAILAGGLASSR